MHAMETGNDLPLLRRAGGLIGKWHHETMIRAAAELGTVQVLCWQSRDLCAASARLVTQAERLVTQSKRSRNLRALSTLHSSGRFCA